MPHDPDWSTIDATIIRWFFQTVSTDIFQTVIRNSDTMHGVWNKITGLFTDNKIQHITFLQQEFFGLHQNDLSLDAYCLRLKTLSNELCDLEFPIIVALLLSMLAAGLGEDLSNAATNLTLLKPTYEQAIAYLCNEEWCLQHLWAHVAHTAFIAGLSHGAPAPPTPAPPPMCPGSTLVYQAPPAIGGNGGHQRRRGHGGNGRQHNSAPANPPPPAQWFPPPPPWSTGHPLDRVVHAYMMPVPRDPHPGILGPRLATHQAFFAAP
jgi:hypothetical protein